MRASTNLELQVRTTADAALATTAAVTAVVSLVLSQAAAALRATLAVAVAAALAVAVAVAHSIHRCESHLSQHASNKPTPFLYSPSSSSWQLLCVTRVRNVCTSPRRPPARRLTRLPWHTEHKSRAPVREEHVLSVKRWYQSSDLVGSRSPSLSYIVRLR